MLYMWHLVVSMKSVDGLASLCRILKIVLKLFEGIEKAAVCVGIELCSEI